MKESVLMLASVSLLFVNELFVPTINGTLLQLLFQDRRFC